MKNSIVFRFMIATAFVCLLTLSAAAQSSGIGAHGYTSIDYDEETNIVTAYAETDVDYDLAGNYQTNVLLTVAKSTGGVAASASAQDNSGLGYSEVVLDFAGEANTTYTATGRHNVHVTFYDYYDYTPYQEFYHDEYYLSYFEGQGVYEPWFHFFESPGYRQATVQIQNIRLGRTFDSASTIITPCSISSTENLILTARQFIGKCCKGSVNDEFPGELYPNTVRDIRDNKSKNNSYQTAWKLISREKYRK